MPGEAARGQGAGGPGLRQDLIWRMEAALFAGFIGLMRLIGLEAASNFGGWVLRTLGPVTGTQKTVLRNLRIAFPEMGDDERRRLALEQWEQTGRTFAETAVMDRLTPASGRIDIVGAERLEAIRASGKPVVFVSGHMANIETMAAVLVASGVPVQVTYRAANNPYVDAQIIAARARYGVKLFAPKGGDGARELLAGMAAQGLCRVGISLTTLDANLSRRMEPRAAAPKRRLQIIERLAKAGIPVRAMIAPVVPGLTDQELEALLAAAKGAGAVAASYIALRLPREVSELFQHWLVEHVPDRAAKIMGRVRELHGGQDYDPAFGKRMRGEGLWADLLERRFRVAVQRLGLMVKSPPLRCDLFKPPVRTGDQPSLF